MTSGDTGCCCWMLDRLSSVIRRMVGWRWVNILVYHHISPDLFEAHLNRLCLLYNIIPLDALIRAIEARNGSSLPSRSLVITFDDGGCDFADLEPVILSHSVPVTHYVPTGCLDTSRQLWFTKIPLGIRQMLKRLPNDERVARLAAEYHYDPEMSHDNRQMLDRSELHRLRQAGVQFGAHTVSHVELPMCDDDTAWREISESKTQLEALLGLPVEHFAFPSGNFAVRDLEFVRRAGFRSARTMRRGWNSVRTDVYQLKVLGPGDDLSLSEIGHLEILSVARRVAKRVDGLHDRLRDVFKLWRKSRTL